MSLNIRKIFYPFVALPFLASIQSVGSSNDEAKPTSVSSEQENTPLFNHLKLEHRKKLEHLINLPDSKFSEIEEGLKELKTFYLQKISYTSDFLDMGLKIKQSGKEELAVLLEKCVKGLYLSDIEMQRQAIRNIDAYRNVHDRHDLGKIGLDEKVQELYMDFFDKRLTAKSFSQEELEININAGLVFLRFAQDGQLGGRFIDWINVQIDNTISEKDKDKKNFNEKCRLLVTPLRILINNNYLFLHRRTNDTAIASTLLPVLHTSANLAKATEDPEVLKDETLLLFYYARNFYSPEIKKANLDLHKEITKALQELFDVTLERITILQNRELINTFIAQIGSLNAIDFEIYDAEEKENEDEETQKSNQIVKEEMSTGEEKIDMDFGRELLNPFVNSFSKHFFQRENLNPDKMLVFLEQIPLRAKEGKSQIQILLYFTFNLILANQDYFISSSKLLKEQYEQMTDKTKKNELRERLIDTFNFFNALPNVSNFEGKYNSMRKELRDLPQKIGAIVTDVRLSDLQNENVIIKLYPFKKERIINPKSWKTLNEDLETVEGPKSVSKIREAIDSRLSHEENPFNRDMCYETLGVVIPLEIASKGEIGFQALEKLKKGIVTSSSIHELRGIAKALEKGFTFERKHGVYNTDKEMPYHRYSHLFEVLKNYNDGKLIFDDLVKLKEQKLTPIQDTILFLVRLTAWDFDLYKELLPECTFETYTKDGKHNEKDFLLAQRLQHNAFVTLSYLAYESKDTALRNPAIAILEKFAGMYTDPLLWGEKTVALFELYTEVYNNGQKKQYFQEKQQFLKNLYLEDDSLLVNGYRITHGNKKTDELKLELAKRFLDAAPSEEMQAYRKHLVELGISEEVLDKAVASVLKIEDPIR